jgi:hypothetical protein
MPKVLLPCFAALRGGRRAERSLPCRVAWCVRGRGGEERLVSNSGGTLGERRLSGSESLVIRGMCDKPNELPFADEGRNG